MTLSSSGRPVALVPLQEICSIISSGGTPSRKHPEYFVSSHDEGHLWVKSKELVDGWTTTTEERITDEAIAQSSAKFYPANTVLLAMYGATVGQLGLLRHRATVNQAICGMVVKSNVAHFRYVFYVLMDRRHELIAKAFGAAQQNLNQGLIRSFKIPLPPLSTQRKIAAVLSAYDDLIENNLRRINTLEEMAQALYHEWFVEFRFPGWENVRTVDSPLGKIPDGWKVGVFGDLAELSRIGISPRRFEAETFAHFSFAAFDSDRVPAMEPGKRIKSSKYLIPGGCMLLSKLNPRIPRVWLPCLRGSYRAITSTEFLVLIPKPSINREFLYSLCKSSEFLGDFAGLALGTSTSHQRVRPNDLLALQVALPVNSLVKRFGDLVAPMLSLADTLREKNTNLRRTRNLLLPKLVSGQLDVSDLDVDIGE